MLDFLADRLQAIGVVRRWALPEELLPENRPQAGTGRTPPPAQPAAAEDQVLFSAVHPPPPAPLPLQPSDPAGTTLRVADVLRRLRDKRQKPFEPAGERQADATEAEPAPGSIIDCLM